MDKQIEAFINSKLLLTNHPSGSMNWITVKILTDGIQMTIEYNEIQNSKLGYPKLVVEIYI